MQAENTTSIKAYLRDKDPKDDRLRKLIDTRVAKGGSTSELIRTALWLYFDPPTPPPDPRLDHLINAIADQQRTIEALRHDTANLKHLLKKVCQDDKIRRSVLTQLQTQQEHAQ